MNGRRSTTRLRCAIFRTTMPELVFAQCGGTTSSFTLLQASRNPCEYGILRSVQRMRMALNEMMAQCNIMACHPSMAMDNVGLLNAIMDSYCCLFYVLAAEKSSRSEIWYNTASGMEAVCSRNLVLLFSLFW